MISSIVIIWSLKYYFNKIYFALDPRKCLLSIQEGLVFVSVEFEQECDRVKKYNNSNILFLKTHYNRCLKAFYKIQKYAISIVCRSCGCGSDCTCIAINNEL